MRYGETSFEGLIEAVRQYNPDANAKMLRDAHDFASGTHKNQKFLQDSHYINHLLRSAKLAADMQLDDETIAAVLLHHAVMESETAMPEIENLFGEAVRELIGEQKKISDIEKRNLKTMNAELLSKVILATAKDIRAIFIRIASVVDVLYLPNKFSKNMLERSTGLALNVYAPIAHKLGLNGIKWLLEDLSFKALTPSEYDKIKTAVGMKRGEREALLEKIVADITSKLESAGINATVQSRVKHFYGIYKKLQEEKGSFSEIYDLLGVRIICDSIKDCYEVLGVVHSHYTPVTKKFYDYIASPKENNYRSIHTAVYKKGFPVFEVQIRTWDMQWNAEGGLAAHWQYKHYATDRHFDKRLSWAKQLVEWQRSKQGKKLMQSLKLGFGKNKIFVFTPKRDVIVLPEKSTPIDFAFAVHTALGLHCEKAKVNGKAVHLSSELNNTDVVEITRSKRKQAKRQWLNIVKSEKAKVRIRRALGLPLSSGIKSEETGKFTQDALSIRVARCCNPIPGDELVGFRTTKRKISVHRADCRNLRSQPAEKMIKDLELAKGKYTVELKVTAADRPGLLSNILDSLASNNAVIKSTKAQVDKNSIVIGSFSIEVQGPERLAKAIEGIEKVGGVYSVERQ